MATKFTDAKKAERRAALKLNRVRVRLASDVIAETENYRGGANGCDDFPMPDYMTPEDVTSLLLDFHTWNGDPEEAEHEMDMGWNSLYAYLSAALLKSVEESLR